ncbi:MAG: aspartate/glutamate racemase family protein [Anaerolineae bacterium]|nr:aspartate/glutamate racemase family protein [Anaerolineae bacterium]
MRIRVISPVIGQGPDQATLESFAAGASPGTEVSIVSLEWGTEAIEVRSDDAWAAPGVLSRAIEAEHEGVDAVIIACMDDPGLYAAREAVRIPVVGPLEASLHLAGILAHRFSIITTRQEDIPAVEELVQLYRMPDRLASVRAMDLPVLELRAGRGSTFDALVAAGERAVREDGAGALIPGCTLLAPLAGRLQMALADRGCEVPVLDPCRVAMGFAEALVSLGLAHSTRTYARPAAKPIAWPTPEAFLGAGGLASAGAAASLTVPEGRTRRIHVRVINPVITSSWEEETGEAYRRAAGPGTEISVASLEWGPASIESYRDHALAVPDILHKAVAAEREGADAVIVDCMGDPGVYAARELVDIPVVGPAEASMHLAAMLGHRFSVLSVLDTRAPMMEDQAARYGLRSRLASVRAFNIPVLALADNRERTLRAVTACAARAVREDGAHVIIPGCTGLAGFAPLIAAGLAAEGCEVPVLDPPSVAIKLAEMLVALGLSHSRRTYARPGPKARRWPGQDE